MVKSKTDKGVTLIAVNTAVEGHIRFSGELYINGAVVGDIVAQKGTQGALVISEEGSVKGEIRVPIVIVGGCVEGDLHASQRVELGKKARIRGDLYYKVVENPARSAHGRAHGAAGRNCRQRSCVACRYP